MIQWVFYNRLHAAYRILLSFCPFKSHFLGLDESEGEICWVSVYFFQNRIMNTSASKKSKVAQRNQRQRVVP